MKCSAKLVSLIIIVLLVIVICLAYPIKNKPEANKASQTEYLKLIYYSEEQFNKSRQIADSFTTDFLQEKIKGGIIPHDLMHGEYVAHFFSNLKKQSPETILIIGPNHKETGSTKLVTASNSWSTPFGVLPTNREIIDGLKENGLASDNKSVIEQEHSISGIIPFIAYYLPKTKVVPLIFKSGFNILDIENLTNSLEKIPLKSIVIVAAVDFSHYLTSLQAEDKDKVTQKALEDFDYKKILTFGERFNDYVDSPPSIAFLILWMKKNNAKIEILANTNSGKLEYRENEPVTSYFEAVYY